MDNKNVKNESDVLKSTEKFNNKLRKEIKCLGTFSIIVILFVAAMAQINSLQLVIDSDWLTFLLILFAFIVAIVLGSKYANLKNKDIVTCSNCFELFVKNKNDKCPYCGKHDYERIN